MALLFQISPRVYVFDCCSSIDFTLSQYDMTVIDFPPLLTMKTIHHFLSSTASWLSLSHTNVLLLHCERGRWSALLIYTGQHNTLDMIYKQPPPQLVQLMPSQLRYLQYVTTRHVTAQWPPLQRALPLDSIIIRFIPNFDTPDGQELVPESTLNSGSNLKSSSSAAPERGVTASADAPEPAKLKAEPKEQVNNIRTPTHVALQEPMSNFELSVDANLRRTKIKPQELQVSLQLLGRSKFITQRVHKGSCGPVSYCNFLQGSPVSMSRYQSNSSALGITALLHDLVTSSTGEEMTHPLTISPTSHSTSAADSSAPKAMQPGQLSLDSIPTPQLPSPSQSPLLLPLQLSGNTTVGKTPYGNPTCPLAAAVTKQTLNTLHNSETKLEGTRQSASVPASPCPSSFVKSSVSAPPPPPPSFYVSKPSPVYSVKNLIPSPPPAPPLPSTSVKNSVPPPSIIGTSSAKKLVSVPNVPPPPLLLPLQENHSLSKTLFQPHHPLIQQLLLWCIWSCQQQSCLVLLHRLYLLGIPGLPQLLL